MFQVLAVAHSNLAVDNMVERLVKTGLRIVRLGHPTKVSDISLPLTADALAYNR